MTPDNMTIDELLMVVTADGDNASKDCFLALIEKQQEEINAQKEEIEDLNNDLRRAEHLISNIEGMVLSR